MKCMIIINLSYFVDGISPEYGLETEYKTEIMKKRKEEIENHLNKHISMLICYI